MSAAADLDRLIADLERDIETATTRLDLARQLRATWSDDQDSADDEPPAPPKPKPTAKKKIACPDCGQPMGSNAGLAIHRKHKHPTGGDADRKAADAVASLVLPDAKRYFVCMTCDARTETREGLAKHTNTAHRRGLKGEEHFARADEA